VIYCCSSFLLFLLFFRDRFEVYQNSRHVAVLCGGNFYKVYVIDENNNPLPESHIIASLQEIKNTEKV
jgi:hypothetical protein